jgi:hypothetical protein
MLNASWSFLGHFLGVLIIEVQDFVKENVAWKNTSD